MKSATKGFLAGVVLTVATIAGYHFAPRETPNNPARTETPSSLVEKIEEPELQSLKPKNPNTLTAMAQNSPPLTTEELHNSYTPTSIDGEWEEVLHPRIKRKCEIALKINNGIINEYRGEHAHIEMTQDENKFCYRKPSMPKQDRYQFITPANIILIDSNLAKYNDHLLKRKGLKEEPLPSLSKIYGEWEMVKDTTLDKKQIHFPLIIKKDRIMDSDEWCIKPSEITRIKDTYIIKSIFTNDAGEDYSVMPIRVIDGNNIALYYNSGCFEFKRK